MSKTRHRLLLLDRDGVINRDSDAYIKSIAEWHALPGALEAIADLCAAGFELAVISNQSGVGRGLFSEAELNKINAHMRVEVETRGGRIAEIYYCPHLPDAGCDCRKPGTELLERAARDFSCPLAGVPFIGDKPSDIEAAIAVGARPILVGAAGAAGVDTAEAYPDLAAAAAQLIAELAPEPDDLSGDNRQSDEHDG